MVEGERGGAETRYYYYFHIYFSSFLFLFPLIVFFFHVDVVLCVRRAEHELLSPPTDQL